MFARVYLCKVSHQGFEADNMIMKERFQIQ